MHDNSRHKHSTSGRALRANEFQSATELTISCEWGERGRGTACADVAASAIGAAVVAVAAAAAVVACEFQSPLSQPVASIDTRVVVVVARICQ